MQKINKKVSAVIVTYNHDKIIFERLINRLLPQTFEIIICNNSDRLLNFTISDKKIFIKEMSGNIGIAAAQNIGMDLAFKNGADFIIQFDQDSVPSTDLIEKLVQVFYLEKNTNDNIGLILSNNGSKKIDSKYSYIHHGISSGTLIQKEIFEKIGKLEEELFIDLVDYEYCWRCRQKGLNIIIVNNALIEHKLGEKSINLLFKKINKAQPFRNYYYFRNSLILFFRGYVPIKWKIKNIINLIILFLATLIIFDNKVKRLKFISIGILDGFRSKYGRINSKIL